MSKVKELKFDDIGFEVDSSQQFATVLFDRDDDQEEALITVIKGGKINQFNGDNKYNPSKRRRASCVYVKEEGTDSTIKICTVQHKGSTLVEVHTVSNDEINYLF